MSAEQLAAGYGAYVSADEIASEPAEPAEAALRVPTSFVNTHCIFSYTCEDDES